MTASALFPAPHISLISLTRDDSTRPAYVARSRSRTADSLLVRVAQGDAVAARECVNRYGNLIWSIARRFAHTHANAEELVGEIFNEIWRSAPRFDPLQGSEAVFVATIARRRLIDRMRHAARQGSPESSGIHSLSWDKSGNSFAACEEARAAARAISQLRPELQRVLERGILQGLSHSEIADQLQLPVGMVKTMMYRGLVQVRELMSER